MTGGLETVPFSAGDVRHVRAALPDISERTACRVLRVSRSVLHRLTKGKRTCSALSEELVTKLEPLIHDYPTYGYRRLWALLRYREGVMVNRKAVYCALRIKQWLVHQRVRTARPRAPRLRSRS